jgi:hypothetical protein
MVVVFIGFLVVFSLDFYGFTDDGKKSFGQLKSKKVRQASCIG